ncbi:MAG: porphobilinogen synthase [Armatimonadetes bacterium]|nr:porphobilinogen synthase [Armatimonadota bacterium]
MAFPIQRLRRLRRTETLRRMVRETRLSVDQLIYPLFITAGQGVQEPIGAMPGNYRWSLDRLPGEIEEIASLGIPAVLLFGIPADKDPEATGAWHERGIVQEALRVVKGAAPELVAVADTCLCEYTSHGHCGRLDERGQVLNDATLELLVRTAVAQAAAGADIIAPSDMMDGRVAAIRAGLDANGFDQIPIMSYAAKFASGFYGPFREAAGSTPAFGDRRGYQMDPPNRREALREVLLDIEEGADIVMVKPAVAYLDIIRDVREAVPHPVAAYHVSGEFSMIKAAAANGWIDEQRVATETLTSIARAGADLIITYYAKDVAGWIS